MIADGLIDPDPPAFGPAFRQSVLDRARARRRRRWQLTSGVMAILLVTASVGAVVVDRLDHLGRVQRIEVAGTQRTAPDEPRTVLLIGSDTREGQEGVTSGTAASGARTDTMVLVRVDPAGSRARILSLPRDLWVGPVSSGHRLNSAFATGGASAVVRDVESLGFQIDHTAVINLDSFVELVDLVGGVEVWVDQPVRDQQAGLEVEAGCTRLEGSQALALTRSRHLQWFDGSTWLYDPTGDLGRLERVQELFVLAVDQVQRQIPNPLKVERLVAWVSENLAVDSELDQATVMALADQMLGIDPNEIERWVVPVADYQTPDGAAVLMPGADFDRTAAAFEGATPPDREASVPKSSPTDTSGSHATGAPVHVRACPND